MATAQKREKVLPANAGTKSILIFLFMFHSTPTTIFAELLIIQTIHGVTRQIPKFVMTFVTLLTVSHELCQRSFDRYHLYLVACIDFICVDVACVGVICVDVVYVSVT